MRQTLAVESILVPSDLFAHSKSCDLSGEKNFTSLSYLSIFKSSSLPSSPLQSRSSPPSQPPSPSPTHNVNPAPTPTPRTNPKNRPHKQPNNPPRPRPRPRLRPRRPHNLRPNSPPIHQNPTQRPRDNLSPGFRVLRSLRRASRIADAHWTFRYCRRRLFHGGGGAGGAGAGFELQRHDWYGEDAGHREREAGRQAAGIVYVWEPG